MTKDQVLAILAREKEFVSGERISEQIGVTRAAVSGAVKALRKDGYEITSVTNRGYRLESGPDHLTAGSIGAFLPEARMGSVLVMEQVDSTNKKLRELSYEGAPDGQVVIADAQTGGRGRRGRSFYSPEGKGIYMSYLLRPDTAPAETVSLTAWTAVAVARAMEKVSARAPSIKWVNDLLLNGGKICGILTELSVESETGMVDSIIIGIGVNVNQEQEEFPEEIQEIATSMAAALGHPVSRAALGAAMVEELDRMRAEWPAARADYLEAYRQLDITAGSDVMVLAADGARSAKALCINEDFSLEVEYPDGRKEALSSGEVSLRICH